MRLISDKQIQIITNVLADPTADTCFEASFILNNLEEVEEEYEDDDI